MINLCLVVIATQFSETKKRETERMAVERARHRRQSRSSSTLTSRASVQIATTAGCYDELLAFLGYLVRQAQRRVSRLFRHFRRRYGKNSQAPPAPAEHGPLQVYAVTQRRRRRKTKKRRRTSSRQRRTGALRRPGEAPYASSELSDIDLTASPRRTTTNTGGKIVVATTSTNLVPLRSTLPGNFNEKTLTQSAPVDEMKNQQKRS